ncbi:MAG: patatin-like phospholipase family protein [Candidatus Delongbacteria bacterium]|nr:patatin-like phospholipase family protein [Candidatus Delongbacteria bacterium]
MESNSNDSKLGLALSGGGYRAATYHIGTFRALKKLELLEKIDVISTNSGGSITGACYALYGEKFEEVILKGVKKGIIRRVIIAPRFLLGIFIILVPIVNAVFPFFNTPGWLNLAIVALMILILAYAQFYILPLSSIIERIYNRIFFKGKKLKDFTDRWKTVLNSTNMETTRLFTFERTRMTDSFYNDHEKNNFVKLKNDEFPVAKAVMASTCVPFAFTPVRIPSKYFANPEDAQKINPRLVDGGVYDNQGIHKLTQSNSSCYCNNVIVSDAGQGFPFKRNYRNLISLLIHTSDVFMERIKKLQMMNSLYRGRDNNSIVAYQSLSFDIESSIPEFVRMLKDGNIAISVIEAHEISNEDIEAGNWNKIKTQLESNIGYEDILSKACTQQELSKARGIGTSLSKLKNWEIEYLIKHAEAITELNVKLFLPHILS